MKKNQQGIAHLALLLILVIVAAVGFVGWKVYDNQKSKNSSQEACAQIDAPANVKQPEGCIKPPVSIGTTVKLDKTYTDTIGKFTLKYPSTWKISTDKNSRGFTAKCPASLTTIVSPRGYKLKVNGYPQGFYCGGGAGDHGPYPVYVYKSVEVIDEQTQYWDIEKQKTTTGAVNLAELIIHKGLKCDYLLNEDKESTGKTDCPTLEKLVNTKNTKPSYYIGLESARLQDKVNQPTPGSNYDFFNFKITKPNSKTQISASVTGDSKLLTSVDGQTIKEILKTFKFTN